ncbi:heparan-alpha-glucosaminide N-acetyltransferase domain-containing protein [Flavobacterium buctense]|uniref:Heparan-alpha-glucosaminide N-acetyltransferase domain-containing protein n=1 Tax=Flavobacterium buctense TaxID=1648146 RepID=A0ABU9E1P4_9FLAO|nr:heparan-alpha-glucosaminide N-acetyltransferase domain-containing protein [Flavobacterium buctense]
MIETITKQRIQSIDFLKGLVMIIMALDHVRDYFHYSAFFYDPTDPTQTSFPIFFTRFITHFCAPAFCFLAGTSAFMVGMRKSKSELSGFLLKRGIWLVFIEMTVVNFAWYFDVYFRSPGLLVIWSLGISMIVLAALIHLPRKAILAFSLLLIFGHNLLNTIHFEGNVFWAILHEFAFFKLTDSVEFVVGYPIIPWIAVMALGYYFGSFYDKSFEVVKRKKLFNLIGILAIITFIILRFTNLYGDPVLFKDYETITKDLISFFNPSKYPPSLLYLLMTLGTTLLILANTEKIKGKVVAFFSTFGRVPFFYYIIHIYLIHLIALLFAELSGFGWRIMILQDWVTESPSLKGYGFPLWVVYSVWILVIILLYPLCKKFDTYKQSHKEKWWLSYL